MKKSIWITAIAAILWAGCSKNEETVVPEEGVNPSSPVKIRKGGRGEGETEEENGEETKDPNQSIFQKDPTCTREKKLKGLKEALKITLI